MASFKLVKSSTIPLTPQLAQEFRDMEPSPTERVLSDNRMKFLQQQAGAGELVNFFWSTATRDGVTRRMNGQHSSRMLCGLNGFFPPGLFVHRDDYEVDGPEGEAMLFRKFDSRASGRSGLDVSGAYQHLYPELRSLNIVTAKLAIDGIAWYLTNIDSITLPSGDDRYLMFERAQASMGTAGRKGPYYDFLCWIDGVVTANAPEMKRAPVVAAMYGSFAKNEAEARVFWEEVAKGGDDAAEDNAYRLDLWLKSAQSPALTLKPNEFYEGSVRVWNAHRAGKAIKDVRYSVDKRRGLSEPAE